MRSPRGHAGDRDAGREQDAARGRGHAPPFAHGHGGIPVADRREVDRVGEIGRLHGTDNVLRFRCRGIGRDIIPHRIRGRWQRADLPRIDGRVRPVFASGVVHASRIRLQPGPGLGFGFGRWPAFRFRFSCRVDGDGGAGGDYGAHLPWVRAGGVHRFGKRRWRRLGRSGAVAVMPSAASACRSRSCRRSMTHAGC